MLSCVVRCCLAVVHRPVGSTCCTIQHPELHSWYTPLQCRRHTRPGHLIAAREPSTCLALDALQLAIIKCGVVETCSATVKGGPHLKARVRTDLSKKFSEKFDSSDPALLGVVSERTERINVEGAGHSTAHYSLLTIRCSLWLEVPWCARLNSLGITHMPTT